MVFDFSEEKRRKNTNFLVHGLPRGFKLPMCRMDCAHLVHRGGAARHKKVICVNPTNWREQEVITDPMMKGRIPHGVFKRIMVGHEAWLKLELSHLAAASFANHMCDLAVALPEARRGVVVAATLAWARSLGEFGPILVFAGATRMHTEIMPTSIFLELTVGNIEAAAAVSLVMVGLAMLVLVAVRVFGESGFGLFNTEQDR